MLMNLCLLSAGIAMGLVFGWALFRAARRRLQLYEAYLHERIETKFRDALTPMAPKPELMIKASGTRDHIGYHCSCCDLEFRLADHVAPKEAVAELYHRFREHVEQAHPESPLGPLRSTTSAAD